MDLKALALILVPDWLLRGGWQNCNPLPTRKLADPSRSFILSWLIVRRFLNKTNLFTYLLTDRGDQVMRSEFGLTADRNSRNPLTTAPHKPNPGQRKWHVIGNTCDERIKIIRHSWRGSGGVRGNPHGSS